jgi:hypothetical protein
MKKYRWLQTAGLVFLILGSGCSKREVPPPPKTQPELLLEIYDSARKNQYNATLLKLQKMRALDPTSVFLAELENTVRFNRLTAVVNTYLQMGHFEAALNALQDYEKRYGYTDYTSRAKERLSLIVQLDRQLRQVRQANRSDRLEQEIKALRNLAKNIKLSPKIENFVRKKESMIPGLRKVEEELMNRELLCETEDWFRTGDRGNGAVLAAIYAMAVPGNDERILALLSGPDPIKKARKQPLSIERKKE